MAYPFDFTRPRTMPYLGGNPMGAQYSQGQDLDGERVKGILGQISAGDKVLNTGLMGGYDLGQALYAPGSLGRINETTRDNQLVRRGIAALIQNPNKQLNQVTRTRDARLNGFTPEERQVFRDEGVEGINRAVQGATRAARSSSLGSGVQGGINALPMQNIAMEAALARRGLERDIMTKNLDERERQLTGLQSVGNDKANNLLGKATLGLNAYGQVSQDELNRQLTNLNQFSKERQGQLGLLFGTAGLTTQRDAEAKANDLANRQLDVMGEYYRGLIENGASPEGNQTPIAPGTPGSPEFGAATVRGRDNLGRVAGGY